MRLVRTGPIDAGFARVLGDDDRLEPGAVLAVEVVAEGVAGSETVVITTDGYETLGARA